MTQQHQDKSAIFPLNTVLFPGGILPLQIFEQRYLQMVKDCMKQQRGFVVVLISQGNEVGDSPEVYRVGTYAEIIDWDTLDNNLLGITIEGRYRTQLNDIIVRDDGLALAHTTQIESTSTDLSLNETDIALLTDTLKELLKHPYAAKRYPDPDYPSIETICHLLGELLPVSNQTRQSFLESINIDQQATRLVACIRELEN